MISETSGLVGQLNLDRVYKENIGRTQEKQASGESEPAGTGVFDTVNFSSQALALAKQVSPAGESPAEEQAEGQGRGQEQETGQQQNVSRYLDVMA